MAYLIAILCLAMIAGVLFVVSIRDSVKKGYEDYEDRTIGQLKEGLADNLLFINPEKLFFITLILTVVISVSFYFLFGFFFAAVAALIAVLLPEDQARQAFYLPTTRLLEYSGHVFAGRQ